MKKTRFGPQHSYSVAMSQDTGCIVMLKIGADDSLKVMGSLDREQSVKLAKEISEWVAAIPKAQKPDLAIVN